MKVLKIHYNLVSEMLDHTGFGWNETLKCVEVDTDDQWESYLKKEPDARGLRNKPFPLFDRLGYIFGKDRATCVAAETAADALEDLDAEVNENISLDENTLGPFTNQASPRTTIIASE
ncbi:hypothetical protein LguiA_021068 [Lonicera macranthoides]